MTDRSKSVVGYKHPPKHSQFIKGQSGNPNGRPKGAKNLATVLYEIARKRVNVSVNGRMLSMTMLEAAVHQLANRAAGGDLKAIRELFYWSRVLAEPEGSAVPAELGEKDKPVLDNIFRRLRQVVEGANASPTVQADATKEVSDGDRK